MPAWQTLREIDQLPRVPQAVGQRRQYRQVDEIRPRTTSRNATFRMILFYTSLFMYNMWGIHHVQKDCPYDGWMLKLMGVLTAQAAIICMSAGVPYDPGGAG